MERFSRRKRRKKVRFRGDINNKEPVPGGYYHHDPLVKKLYDSGEDGYRRLSRMLMGREEIQIEKFLPNS